MTAGVATEGASAPLGATVYSDGVSFSKAAHLKEQMNNAIMINLEYAHEHGRERPEIANWTWLH